MPVFTMNVPCQITSSVKFDVYGEPVTSKIVKTKCAVVKFELIAKQTTVRADSSATRGHAEELDASVVLLLSKKNEPQINDLVFLRGECVRVISKRPRYDVMSRLDHYEIGCCVEQR